MIRFSIFALSAIILTVCHSSKTATTADVTDITAAETFAGERTDTLGISLSALITSQTRLSLDADSAVFVTGAGDSASTHAPKRFALYRPRLTFTADVADTITLDAHHSGTANIAVQAESRVARSASVTEHTRYRPRPAQVLTIIFGVALTIVLIVRLRRSKQTD